MLLRSALPLALLAACATTPRVTPLPSDLRVAEGLDPWYQKLVMLEGFPILGSAEVSDEAMLEAAWILERMLAGREDLLHAMATDGVHLVVMAATEYTTDVPEQRNMTPKVFWDRRARGLGGNPVSCAEENLLGFPGDPYSTENILIHEFAHIVHGSGLGTTDPTFDQRLAAAYVEAIEAGLWDGTYAATNRGEYWAEAVQSWFDDNRQDDALHNHVDTRAELRAYDPPLAALCEEVFGDGDWRYVKTAERDAAGRAHLAGLDLDDLPRFRWREAPLPERPRVQVDVPAGKLVLELERARPGVAAFVRAVHEGAYSDGALVFEGGGLRLTPRGGGEGALVGVDAPQGMGAVVEGGGLGGAHPIQRAVRLD